MSECIVCFEETTTLAKPCNHVICPRCATLWLTKSPTCPTCRGIIVSLVPPLSTDDEVCPHGSHRRREQKHERKCMRKIEFECEGQHVGITLANTTRFAEAGVCVISVYSRDRAFMCDVCVGDVITHINGIRVSSHADAIRVIQRATDIGASMELAIIRRRRITCSSLLLGSCKPTCP